MDLKMILTGSRSLNYADVFSGSPPSVQRRMGNMSWELYNTTSKPTKTHEMTYKISKAKYDEVYLKKSNFLFDLYILFSTVFYLFKSPPKPWTNTIFFELFSPNCK